MTPTAAGGILLEAASTLGPMSKRSWVASGAVLALAVVVLGAAWATRDPSDSTPSGSPANVDASQTAASGPTSTPLVTPDQTTDATPSPSSLSTPTLTAPATTLPPRASGPARLAYADFLRRVNDDRATVERLNGSLTTAAQALDPVAVRGAAVDILDFVDAERDWLRENPPAGCYADAHASAGAMLDAYGVAAGAFISWAETGGGIAGLSALGDALDVAKTAGDALTTFGHVLEVTSCPA